MKRILFVDDAVDLPAAGKIVWEKNGCAVATKTSCKEGLKTLLALSPDLILLGVNVGDEVDNIVLKPFGFQGFVETSNVYL